MSRRRRRNNKFKATRTVIAIIFMTFIALIIYFILYHNLSEMLVDKAEARMASVYRQQTVELASANQTLQDKLKGTKSLQTSTSVKALSKYYIKKYFGNDADKAERIFTCESGLNPQAININQGIHAGSADRGIAQINDKFHKARFEKMFGVPFEIGAHDTDMNIKYAKFLYDNSKGFGPWVCARILASR